MVLPRPTTLRGFAPARLLRATPRTAYRGQWQRIAQRGYATEHGSHGAASSDLPWLLSAVAVTIPSCWLLWPESSSGHAHHPPVTDIEHADPEKPDVKNEAPEGQKPVEGGEENEEEESKDEGEKAAEDSNSKNEAEDSDKPEGEEKKDDGDDSLTKTSESKNQPESGGNVEGVQFKGPTKEGENGAPDERKVEDDSKGGKKKRIDSGYGKNLGEGETRRPDGTETAVTSKDVPDDSGATSNKQAGLSNTPTRHSKDIGSDPNKSKKGEGVPETAKAQGTVSPNRPTPEQGNKKRAEGEKPEGP